MTNQGLSVAVMIDEDLITRFHSKSIQQNHIFVVFFPPQIYATETLVCCVFPPCINAMKE